MKQILIFAIIATVFISCEQEADQVVFESANKILHNKNIQYQYRSHWDNRFNKTTFQDSAKVTYSKIPNLKKHFFGFYINHGKMATLFDGSQIQNIDHNNKMIIVTDSSSIINTLNKSDYHFVFSSGPLEILTSAVYDSYIDTIIDSTQYVIGRNIKTTPSTSDSTQIVTNDDFYYFNRQTKLLDRKKSIIILEGDTMQVINHYFSDYQFDTIPFDFNTINRDSWQSYNIIAKDDFNQKRHLQQKQVGDKLMIKTYQDINNQRINLYGNGKKTVIMFSFIGCHACELALKDFKAQDYKFNPNVDFYYSNPQDKREAVAKFAKRKGFSFPTFARESMMYYELRNRLYPTFVVVADDGTIEKIFTGYDKSVLNILF
ncbi:MAG: TlpA family protein disulfide reductase [Saprospiraceae bacterium]